MCNMFLQELCERLWDITDKRKVEDEKERGALMGEGFLHDHAAALANHHTVLMQVAFYSIAGLKKGFFPPLLSTCIFGVLVFSYY